MLRRCQPWPRGAEGLKSPAVGIALTNCLVPPFAVPGCVPAVTQQAPHVGGSEPVFSSYRGSSSDCDAQGRASRPPPRAPTQAVIFCAGCRSSFWLAGGRRGAGYPPSPPTPYKHSSSPLLQHTAAAAQVLPQGADELLDASVPSSQHVPRGCRASHHLPGKVRGFAMPQGWEAED